MLELLWLLLTTVVACVRPRQDLVLENLLLRHQLGVLTRPTRTGPRARLRAWDKLVWVLARSLFAGWREHLRIVKPDTGVRWHRQGWRLFWRWKSLSRGGRPHLSPEVRELIVTMSRKNKLWGTERIRGELLKLGIVVYGRDFRQRTRRVGIDAIATPIHAPQANAIAERVIGTLRRECLNHVIVLDERHLMSVLIEFVQYYNQERPHRTLGLQTPVPRLRPVTGPIHSRSVLNGLHRSYERIG